MQRKVIVIMDKTAIQEKAMKNAISSVSMEGLNVTAEMIELCRQVLTGKRNTKECLELLELSGKEKAEAGGK